MVEDINVLANLLQNKVFQHISWWKAKTDATSPACSSYAALGSTCACWRCNQSLWVPTSTYAGMKQLSFLKGVQCVCAVVLAWSFDAILSVYTQMYMHAQTYAHVVICACIIHNHNVWYVCVCTYMWKMCVYTHICVCIIFIQISCDEYMALIFVSEHENVHNHVCIWLCMYADVCKACVEFKKHSSTCANACI